MKYLQGHINDIIDEFLESRDVENNSRDLYKKIFRYFTTWLVKNNIDPGAIKGAHLIGYKGYLKERGLSPYTIDSYLVPPKALFRWLSIQRRYPDIGLTIKREKKSSHHTKDYLTIPEIKKLLNCINRSTEKGKRDYAMIRLLSITGLRCVEASRLNIDDLEINNDLKIINILRKGHNQKAQLVIPDQVYQSLIDYIETREDPDYTDPLFMSRQNNRLSPVVIGHTINQRLKEAGIKKKRITAHSLRHSAAINALGLGESIYSVQHMLGHRNISTTEIYLRAVEKERRTNNTVVHALDKAYK